MDDKLMSPKEVAEFMGVEPRTVRNWVLRGRLVPLRMSKGTVRFSEKKLLLALEKFENGEPPALDPAMG